MSATVLKQARIGGLETAWRDVGAGEPVVFLHGFPLHSGMWLPQLTRLPPGFRGIAPDVRGFGGTEIGSAPAATMDLLADDVAALLDHLGVGRVVLCGLSMGGYVALAFMRRFPKRARALVLADTRAGADGEEGRRGRQELAARVRRDGVAPLREAMLPKLIGARTRTARPDIERQVGAMIDGTSPEAAARALLGMAERPDSTPSLRAIAVPTLVLVGADDVITPPGEAQLLTRGIPGSRIETVADAGHLSSFEQPEAFNRSLHLFLGLSVNPDTFSISDLKF